MRARWCRWFVAVPLIALLVAAPAVSVAARTTNPTHNDPEPALADATGECTSSNGGPYVCPSPCYPRQNTLGADGAMFFGLVHSRACTTYVLRALNTAQAGEEDRSIVLPNNYFALSVTEQLFVMTNLERITHHVAPLVGLTASLDAIAAGAAEHGADPSDPGVTFSSIWAGGDSTPVGALYGWMYDDGWGGSPTSTLNYTCTSPTASGCWGHRDNILGAGLGARCVACVAGAGFASSRAPASWSTSYAMIFEDSQPGQRLVFTWNHDVVAHLGPAYERVRAG